MPYCCQCNSSRGRCKWCYCVTQRQQPCYNCRPALHGNCHNLPPAVVTPTQDASFNVQTLPDLFQFDNVKPLCPIDTVSSSVQPLAHTLPATTSKPYSPMSTSATQPVAPKVHSLPPPLEPLCSTAATPAASFVQSANNPFSSTAATQSQPFASFATSTVASSAVQTFALTPARLHIAPVTPIQPVASSVQTLSESTPRLLSSSSYYSCDSKSTLGVYCSNTSNVHSSNAFINLHKFTVLRIRDFK